MSDKQIILGVDPGTRFTGYGIIQFNGNHVEYITSGVLSMTGELNDRLYYMFKKLQNITKTHKPNSLAIETSFVHKNIATAIKLGQAKGMLMGAVLSACEKISIFEYTPRQIKQNVAGQGGAQKSQLNYMVKLILNLDISIQPDASDALSCALCHYNHYHLLNIL